MHPNVTSLNNHQKGAWILSFVALAFGINANIASAQTARQRKALEKCGVGFVLPSWLPLGFKMATFKLEDCSESRFPGYDITYNGPSQCELRLSGRNGGFGAPGWVREWQVKTKLFGTVVLAELAGSRSNGLNAMIIDSPYFKSYPRTGYIYSFSCENKLFNVNDAKRILQSSALVP